MQGNSDSQEPLSAPIVLAFRYVPSRLVAR